MKSSCLRWLSVCLRSLLRANLLFCLEYKKREKKFILSTENQSNRSRTIFISIYWSFTLFVKISKSSFYSFFVCHSRKSILSSILFLRLVFENDYLKHSANEARSRSALLRSRSVVDYSRYWENDCRTKVFSTARMSRFLCAKTRRDADNREKDMNMNKERWIMTKIS